VKNSELFSLDETIAKFVLPRLKKFKEISPGSPISFLPKNYPDLDKEAKRKSRDKARMKWEKILDQMVCAFEYSLIENQDYNPVEFKNYENGMKLFTKYFLCLWW
jgi:hypothetical protein